MVDKVRPKEVLFNDHPKVNLFSLTTETGSDLVSDS